MGINYWVMQSRISEFEFYRPQKLIMNDRDLKIKSEAMQDTFVGTCWMIYAGRITTHNSESDKGSTVSRKILFVPSNCVWHIIIISQ